MSFFKDSKAFTLIELIIVIAIIALISAAVFVSVNPAKRLGDARDSVRASDAVAIEKAIQKSIADNYIIPPAMAALTEDTPYMLVTEGAATSGTCNCNTSDTAIARVDLADEFKTYTGGSIPVDEDATGDDTGYYIIRKGNSFYVESCNAYEDEYVAAIPETITCYFDDYDLGGETWQMGANMMTDNNIDTTFASAFVDGDVEKLIHSTCASETFGTISQVRTRAYGTCDAASGDGIILRPVFNGTTDGDDYYEEWPAIPKKWWSWQDITSGTNAPGTWTTSDVVNLDLDVETSIASSWCAVYKVELEVVHVP